MKNILLITALTLCMGIINQPTACSSSDHKTIGQKPAHIAAIKGQPDVAKLLHQKNSGGTFDDEAVKQLFMAYPHALACDVLTEKGSKKPLVIVLLQKRYDLVVWMLAHGAGQPHSYDKKTARTLSNAIQELYFEAEQINNWTQSINFDDLKNYFIKNKVLVFTNCVFYNNNWITPVEYFYKKQSHELVLFLLTIKLNEYKTIERN